jgi:hypothetical protein
MPKSDVFLDYHGPVDFTVIDNILTNLKKTQEYRELNKTTAKRVYSLVVECLENICKHSELKKTNNPALESHITVEKISDKIIVTSGNTVTEYEKRNIATKLDHLAPLDEPALLKLYEDILKSELEGQDRCAGLGFISMALKSGNNIYYSFNKLKNGYSYFKIQITLNQYIMRKLIIEPRSNSPEVILDPEKKIYLISGESRPPDVREFYEPVLEWLEEFGSQILKSSEKDESIPFNFNFDYFNSSSGKSILDICKILSGLRAKGINVNINWHSEKDDYDMLEAGKEISRIVKFPFEFIEAERD